MHNDVSADMADLLDFYAARGENLSIQEAYDKACAMNPEILAVKKSRETQQTLASKKAAATSIHGTRGGSPAPVTATSSMADDIASAWDSQGQI